MMPKKIVIVNTKEAGEESSKKQRTTEEAHGEKESRDVTVRDDSPVENSSSISVTLSDPEVLDCNICMEPLISPVFQCKNGHVACCSCCKKLKNMCPACSFSTGSIRCLLVEKIIESIKLSCENAQYGCEETFIYSQKTNHEEKCMYAPCLCPIVDCNFLAASGDFPLHFKDSHSSSAIRFRYNKSVSVRFEGKIELVVLQEEEDGRMFLLSNRVELFWNSVTLNSIASGSLKGTFLYELMLRTGSDSLRFQSYTKCVDWRQESSSSTGFFLPVQCDFVGYSGQLKLDVTIWNS